MVLMPKRVKYRKAQRGKIRGIANRGSRLTFGEFGLKAIENGVSKISKKQIDSEVDNVRRNA